MSTKIIWTGATIILAVPAVFSGELVAMAGGLCMVIGAVIMWLEKS